MTCEDIVAKRIENEKINDDYKHHFGTAVYSNGTLHEYQRDYFRKMITSIYNETLQLTEGKGVTCDPARIHHLICHSHKLKDSQKIGD